MPQGGGGKGHGFFGNHQSFAVTIGNSSRKRAGWERKQEGEGLSDARPRDGAGWRGALGSAGTRGGPMGTDARRFWPVEMGSKCCQGYLLFGLRQETEFLCTILRFLRAGT